MDEKSVKSENITKHVKILAGLLENKYWTFAIAVAIIAVNVFLRVPLLRFQGMFEPDGFFYYAVVRQAVQSNFVVSNYLNISGFPWHNFIGEAPGLIYMTVIPYFFLRFMGISYYTTLRLIPVLFGILYAILAYYLVQYIHKSKFLGLLAMFFVSASSGNIARTAATVYRGDSFISLFLMLGLIFMLRALSSSDRKSKYLNTGISAFVLSLGITVWTGYSFIIAIYMLTLLILLAYGFVKADHDLLWTNTLLTVGLLGTSLLDDVWVLLGLGRAGGQLAGSNFFVFWITIMLGNALAIYLIKNKHKINLIGSVEKRIGVVLAVVAVMLVLYLVLFGEVIGGMLGSVGITNAASSPIGGTTQELQKPSYAFLFASFSLQLYLAPFAILLFLFFANKIHNREHFKIKGMAVNVNNGFLVMLAYFMITAFLQLAAIRWNALLSVPMAIFAAYGVYAIFSLAKGKILGRKAYVVVVGMLFGAFAVCIMYYDVVPLFTLGNILMVAIATLITALLVGIFAYDAYAVVKTRMELKYVCAAFIGVLLLFNFYGTYVSSYSSSQADGINTHFLDAMTWMSGNTPKNATVWAIWPDGSVVEGWANRTNYMDSVGGENGTRIYYSARFLFNTSNDTQYLYDIGRPQYIVARGFWYQELGGLAVEGNITNASDYGYASLPILNITQNETARFYAFSSPGYPYYRAMMITERQTNGTDKFFAYLGAQGSNRYAPIKNVMFFNTSNYGYNIVKTAAENDTRNYTLLISYKGNVISGGAVLGPSLFNSNIFKFTFLCNQYACPFGSANTTLTAVYINNDTRIFRVNYG